MKRCRKCKIEKSVVKFSKCKHKKDGLQDQCKTCDNVYYKAHKDDIKVYQQSHKKEIKVYQKAYRQTEVCRKSRKASDTKRCRNNPEKRKAISDVNHAVQAGKIERSMLCRFCGLPAKTEGHHADYSRPLEVVWLCPECHAKLHEKLKEGTKND